MLNYKIKFNGTNERFPWKYQNRYLFGDGVLLLAGALLRFINEV